MLLCSDVPDTSMLSHCQVCTCLTQVEALLDRTGGQTPLIDYVATQFESLGYHSWAHRVISSAGHLAYQTCFLYAISSA